jgi:hypothetical protein
LRSVRSVHEHVPTRTSQSPISNTGPRLVDVILMTLNTQYG